MSLNRVRLRSGPSFRVLAHRLSFFVGYRFCNLTDVNNRRFGRAAPLLPHQHRLNPLQRYQNLLIPANHAVQTHQYPIITGGPSHIRPSRKDVPPARLTPARVWLSPFSRRLLMPFLHNRTARLISEGAVSLSWLSPSISAPPAGQASHRSACIRTPIPPPPSGVLP